MHGPVQAPAPLPDCEQQEQEHDDVPSSTAPPADQGEKKEKGMAITSIRATDVSLGLRRIPAAFHVIVYHSGLEWRTDSKRTSTRNDVLEWNEPPIPLPSDPAATVDLEIYASFELQPTLGLGEQLRKLTVSVQRLLDSNPMEFTFSPKDGDVLSPCSSLHVTVGEEVRKASGSSASRNPDPHPPPAEWQHWLENATDQGHSALSRYRKYGEKQDLERSLEEFERAVTICPVDHPHYAAVQSNMATAKFIHCQVDDTELSFDVPFALYHDALAARPIGHPDRTLTLIHLAAVLLAQFGQQQDEADLVHAEVLLNEAKDLSSAEDHENSVANFMLQLHAGREIGAVQGSDKSSSQLDSTSGFIDEDEDTDLLDIGTHLFVRFKQHGDLDDLQQATLFLEAFVSSTSHRGRPYIAGLSNLGLALLSRFRCFGELGSLDQAISRFTDAIDLLPDDDPEKPGRLNNLSISLRARFERFGELGDLEKAISRATSAVDLAPDGHPEKPGFLSTLGISLRARFQHLGELGDLEQVILRTRDAVDLTPDGHPEKPGFLTNLGISLLSRFQHLGELGDLEQAISTTRDAVNLTPECRPERPSFLNNLSDSLRLRFGLLGELGDIEEAISRTTEAVSLIPDGHRDKPVCLSNLGSSFLARFEHLGELSDLEQVICQFRDAVRLTPDHHPQKHNYLNNLGTSLLTRFEHLRDLDDLEQAISNIRHAVDLTPDGYPDKPNRLSNLADTFATRFERLGELDDLERAISRFRDAVDLTPDGNPARSRYLSNLGNTFFSRFQHLGVLDDLQQAISRLGDATDLIPDGHPDRPDYLSRLGGTFFTRFQRVGDLSDLERSISKFKDAVDLTPDDHPQKPSRLSNLGSAFLSRFERLEELNDLEQAISRATDAANLIPNDHPDKPGCLGILGNSFSARFERLGLDDDLEQAILHLRAGAELVPDGRPFKPGLLSDLGSSLTVRFEHFGELSDLQQAISRLQDAVNHTPSDHPGKHDRLSNLGISFLTRFERLGELGDLEEAISRFRGALDLTPDGYPSKPRRLSHLGYSLRARFQRLGELNDLQQAISMMKDAVDLLPYDHPDRPSSLGKLGNSFTTRFERLGELDDLEQAISRIREAADLTPDDHPHKATRLSNLCNSLRVRFERLGKLDDLEQAVLRAKDAVDLTPDSHPQKPARLNNLGNSLLTRFQQLEELDDLERAISTFRDALDLTPDDHPHKPSSLYNFGHTFVTRFRRLNEPGDLEQAISIYSQATHASVGTPAIRFYAARNWIACAGDFGHQSLLDAYSSAIDLLPQMAWTGVTLTTRYHELLQSVDVVREAAAAALDLGHVQTAVEWLEQGRSIIWGDLFQLRSSYDELAAVHPDHARRLRELSAALDNATATHEKSLSILSEEHHVSYSAGRATEPLEEEATRHRALAIQRDQLLQEIRGLPSFERFLLHKEICQLRASAHSGPVVVLNAAENRCDALIVLADVDDVMHVPLLDFTLKRLEGLQTSLKRILHLRKGQRMRIDRTVSWKAILSTLWKFVVKPVLEALAISTPGNSLRIFWCPTGPFTFLPIHAAGLYDEQHLQPGNELSDFVISSYIPTLSILAPSVESDDTCSGSLRFLAVRQPSSDGLFPLPGVDEELAHIEAVVQNSQFPQTTLLESPVGTVEDVLRLMKDADWVHFACHGTQDDERPIDSGLCLADGRRLKLSDMIGLSRPRGGLAFLSACETAMGDKALSDEAIHIAAGMLFAGYGSVIATMWSISDRIAPGVAKDVYEHLFRKSTRPDAREAARALQDAVGRIRDGGASFDEWLPFIHVGL